jgi:hypothetical protein
MVSAPGRQGHVFELLLLHLQLYRLAQVPKCCHYETADVQDTHSNPSQNTSQNTIEVSVMPSTSHAGHGLCAGQGRDG